jgi:hypothetical protein
VARIRSRGKAPGPVSTSTNSSSPVSEAREPLLARFHGLHRGPVLLEEAEDLAAGQDEPDVAAERLMRACLVRCWSLAQSRRASNSAK